MTRKLLAVLAVAALVAAPAVASAQISTGVSIAAGIAIPKGDGSDGIDNGYDVAVGLNLGAPLMPVGVRIEGAYNSFNLKGSTSNNKGDIRIISGTANATFGIGLGYVIGGVGYYSGRGSATINGVTTTGKNTNAIGYNGGVGIRFPLGVISTFAEARYHHAGGDLDLSYIPITFGINF